MSARSSRYRSVKRAVNSMRRLSGTPAGSRSTWPGREPMATSIPALKPDSEIVSGGRGIIKEFPTLRILRVMITARLYNVIWSPMQPSGVPSAKARTAFLMPLDTSSGRSGGGRGRRLGTPWSVENPAQGKQRHHEEYPGRRVGRSGQGLQQQIGARAQEGARVRSNLVRRRVLALPTPQAMPVTNLLAVRELSSNPHGCRPHGQEGQRQYRCPRQSNHQGRRRQFHRDSCSRVSAVPAVKSIQLAREPRPEARIESRGHRPRVTERLNRGDLRSSRIQAALDSAVSGLDQMVAGLIQHPPLVATGQAERAFEPLEELFDRRGPFHEVVPSTARTPVTNRSSSRCWVASARRPEPVSA